MMRRKDCDKTQWRGLRRHSGARLAVIVVSACAAVGSSVEQANAGSVRIWATAVVVTDQIHLDDVCELRNFDDASEKALHEAAIGAAPGPGGTLIISQQVIREALRAAGINMATVTVSGSSRCTVTRPATPAQPSPTAGHKPTTSTARGVGAPGKAASDSPAEPSTLRSAVIDFFNNELQRYDARAEVTFDRTSEQLLNLAGPTYTFRVRGRIGAPLGLIPIDVDVISGDSVVQSVPLVVSVSMLRSVVVARRSINQDATIRPGDVERMPLRFNRTDKIGLATTSQIVGQRAKRFIAAGSMMSLNDVESVPLVVRGQLVTLESAVGGVRVVTTGKATQDGLLGETITVRAADDKRVEFDAVVVGVSRVRIGALPVQSSNIKLAEAGS